MRRLLMGGGTVLLVLARGLTAAFAHAFLISSTPAAGAVLTAPPPAVVLSYTEPFDVGQITVTVSDAEGTQVASDKDTGFTIDWATATLPLPALAPDTYTVTWDVNLRPGHETHGQFAFAVTH